MTDLDVGLALSIAATQLQIGYSRGDSVAVFDEISVRESEVIAIVGASGAGKSTLLFTLGLMIEPLSGALSVLGQDVAQMTERGRSKCRASALGFLFQDASLDPRRSLLDNIVEGGIYSGTRRGELVSSAEELASRLDVQADLARPPGKISGGQAQRVAMARALVVRRRLVLADEPTGNLDRETADRVLGCLREEADSTGTAVLIATHDEHVVEWCDRVIAVGSRE